MPQGDGATRGGHLVVKLQGDCLTLRAPDYRPLTIGLPAADTISLDFLPTLFSAA